MNIHQITEYLFEPILFIMFEIMCLHPGQILLAVESGIDVFDGVYPH